MSRPEGHRCEAQLAQLDRYLDDELDGAARRDFESRVETCAGCREELRLARRLSEDLKQLAEECPESVVAAVLERASQDLERPESGGRGAGRPQWWLTLAAALGGVLLIGGLLLDSWGPGGGGAVDEEELRLAELQVRYVLGYVGEVSRRSGEILIDDGLVGEVVVPLRRAVRNVVEKTGDGNDREGGGEP